MLKPELPANEAERVLLLKQLGLLDTEEEDIYDDVTKLASIIADTPICLISLIDNDRQWFKSHHGLTVRETPRDVAFCAHAINDSVPFIVGDASKDPRFHDNPLVTGEPHVIFYAGAPLTLPTGHNLGTLCVIDDKPHEISPEQIKQLQLLASHIVHLFVLRGKLSFLSLVENAKDKWLANLSHDLKNPASTIIGFSSMMEGKLDTLSKDELRQYLKTIMRASSSLMVMLDDIIELSRIDSDCVNIELQRTDLRKIIDNVVSQTQDQARQCRVTLAYDVGSARYCLADPKRLEQVVINLVSNAIRYSHNDSIVEITTDKQNNQVRLHVINQGDGIEPAKQRVVFERFGLAGNKPKDTDRDTGTGLGLALSKQLVEKMNGTISVQSTPGEQTIFTVAMPNFEDN